MEKLVENNHYNNMVICSTCSKEFNYHVTDIKGIDSSKYVYCPECGNKVYLERERNL